MINFQLKDILALPKVHGVNMDGLTEKPVIGISTDTRTIQAGEVYLALRGNTYDGHSYIVDAQNKGAKVCVVESSWFKNEKQFLSGQSFIIVPNTLKYYGKIASAYKSKFDVIVIGITGSNGKTTTKELLRAVLGTKYNVLASKGNFNNQIGVAYTLLQLESRHQIVIVEMGTNRPGDIEELCEIAGPDQAVITNVGRSHLEGLKDISRVGIEKMKLFDSLPEGGIAYINADDPILRYYNRNEVYNIRYGYSSDADIRIQKVIVDKYGRPVVKFYAPALGKKEFQIHMSTFGYHTAYLAAIGFAVGAKHDCAVYKMKEVIQTITSPEKRLNVFSVHGVTCIDDTYNANPESVKAALDTLVNIPTSGRKIFIFGEMLELGKNSWACHEEIGEYAAQNNVDAIYTYGAMAEYTSEAARKRSINATHYKTIEELSDVLVKDVHVGDTVLVKGSRSVNMSLVVDSLKSYNNYKSS